MRQGTDVAFIKLEDDIEEAKAAVLLVGFGRTRTSVFKKWIDERMK